MGDRHEFSDKLSFLFLTELGKFEPVPYFSLPSPTDVPMPYQWSCLLAKVLDAFQHECARCACLVRHLHGWHRVRMESWRLAWIGQY